MNDHSGESVCRTAGKTRRRLLSPNPCKYDTASFVRYKGLWWFINVSNCRAELCAAENITGKIRYKEIVCPKDMQDTLQKLVEESVEEHGALNISGLYGPADRLISFIEEKGIKAVTAKTPIAQTNHKKELFLFESLTFVEEIEKYIIYILSPKSRPINDS